MAHIGAVSTHNRSYINRNSEHWHNTISERGDMPNIVCKGKHCTIKEECRRYTPEPKPWQECFVESPCSKKMGGTACEYFTPNRRESVGEEE